MRPRRPFESRASRAARQTSAAVRRSVAQAARQSLTGEEIDAILVQAMIDRAFDAGFATAADLARLNIPADRVTPERLRRCLALARERCPRLDDTFNPAA